MHLRSLLFMSIAASGLASGACDGSRPIIPDRCFVIVATVTPKNPTMHVGDTLQLHAAFTGSAECWPADTAAAALRWSSVQSSVHLDSLTGLVTAIRAGNDEVMMRGVKTGTLGSTFVTVVRP